MSRQILPLMLLVAFVQPVIAQTDPESIEPPLGYSLQVGDKVIRLKEGEPAQLAGTFANPKITLTSDDYRVFPYAGISFRYPSYFAFEADSKSKTLHTWVLSGNDCKIMIHQYKLKVDTSDLVEALVDRYGKENTVQSDVSLTLAGQTLNGKRIKAKIFGSTFVQDLIPIPSTKGVTILLLQDSPNDDGTASDERRLLEKRLVESFAISKQKP